MEDKNYRDDFELFLKESADDFRMVPSRKVWYSLYNNMHPDRRWPSISVCLLILAAVLYIGIENNNTLSSASVKVAEENLTTKFNADYAVTNATFLAPVITNEQIINQQKKAVALLQKLPHNAAGTAIASNSTYNSPQNIEKSFTSLTSENNNLLNVVLLTDELNIKVENKLGLAFSKLLNNVSKTRGNVKSNTLNNNAADDNDYPTIEPEIVGLAKNETGIIDIETSDVKSKLNKEKLEKALLIEKSWKEDYAFRNKPAMNKLKENGSISYYITPSVGYRSLSKRVYNKNGALVNNSYPSQSNDKELTDNAALNLEFGVALKYKLSKNIYLKTGFQANYSNYTSTATALGHPSQVVLAVSNTYLNPSASVNYSTAAGETKLNRSTVQVSVPMGADFRLAGNGKLKWFVGASLQPTYVLKGSSYVLSVDKGYYAKEPPLLRKLNLNTAIETFISFKPSPNLTMSVGPQLRYQVMSTYTNQYNYSEKLYNLGLKIGIATSL